MIKIPIRLIDKTLPVPKQATDENGKVKGDWIDLYARTDIMMFKGDFKLIPLNVAMQLPKGYEAHVLPRSSTFKNFGILMTNGMGIIDCSYCGDNDEWRFPAYATRNILIKKGDRIAQMRIVSNMDAVEFEVVDSLGNSDRGGFGTTGVGNEQKSN